MENITYFGTSLTSKGHYFWDITHKGLVSKNVPFTLLPFNPEDLPRHPNPPYGIFSDGHCAFYNENGYSIFAITGSCTDHRPNSKSVFFVKDNVTFQQLWEGLCEYKVFQDMLGQMDFRVRTELI